MGRELTGNGDEMEPAKQDRRVRKTKARIFEALIQLMMEKGYDRATVQDIIDRADVGRSTFYAHYRDKEALLQSGFEELRPAFETSQDDDADPSLAIFRHIGEYTHVYRAIAGRRGGHVVIGHLRRILTELYGARLRARVDQTREPTVPVDVGVEYLVSALIGIVQWGLERSEPATPEQLHDWFQQLVIPGVRATLGVTP
jgi:AcrR family transcriptional regulator